MAEIAQNLDIMGYRYSRSTVSGTEREPRTVVHVSWPWMIYPFCVLLLEAELPCGRTRFEHWCSKSLDKISPNLSPASRSESGQSSNAWRKRRHYGC